MRKTTHSKHGSPLAPSMRALALALALTAAAGVVGTADLAWAQEEAAGGEDEATEKAKARFLEGREAYDARDFATAIARWEEAFAIKPNEKLLIYIARAYDQLGKPGKALGYLERYAALGDQQAAYIKDELNQVRKNSVRLAMRSAAVEVDQAVHVSTPGSSAAAPREREQLEIDRVFAEVPFAVVTNPPGATVYIDDKEFGSVGTTPVNLKVFTGKHTVWVEKPFHAPREVEIHVRPVTEGAPPQKVTLTLERQMVPVEIKTIPDNAEITLLKDTGETLTLGKGGFKGNLPAGETRFFLKATGLGQKEFDKTILASEVAESGFQHVEFDMRDAAAIRRSELAQVGTLSVEGYLIGADILVNDKVVGQTPRFALDLAPGPHSVEIRKPGFKSIYQLVRVEPGETVVIETPETLEPVSSSINWAGWLTLTGGVAVAGAGGAFTFLSLDKQGEADNLVQPASTDRTPEAAARRQAILDLEEEADTFALVSYGLYGVGGAMVVTGALILAFGRTGDETRVVEGERPFRFVLTPHLQPNAAGLTFTMPWQ